MGNFAFIQSRRLAVVVNQDLPVAQVLGEMEQAGVLC